jgi:hypothetical protein
MQTDPRWRLALALLSLTGCGYRAGSFSFIGTDYPSKRTSTRCLDLGVGAHSTSRDDAPVVMYAFGNRCDAPLVVDLRAARAWGVVATGDRVPLVPHDPRREIVPKPIAANWAGSAAIEYLPARRGIHLVFIEVCVEVTGIVPDLSASYCFDPRLGASS